MSCKNRGPIGWSRTRRLFNNPNDAVDESLRGMAMINRGMVVLEGCRAILRRDYNALHGKVKLIAGGGAGNEPTHAGFVGPGMLTAAISGDLFSAPPSHSILRLIRELATDHLPGVLIIVQNYTGYRMNFSLATMRAQNEGLVVKLVIVQDDMCLKTFEKTAGRRGLAATLFIEKIAGAMAEEGRDLDEIHAVCTRIAYSGEIATIGLCTRIPLPPGICSCMQSSASEQMEIGLGIHGEPGVSRVAFTTTSDIVSQLLKIMTEGDGDASLKFKQPHGTSTEIAVMINNLGGSSQLEMGVFAMEVIQQLSHLGLKVERVYMGTLMTSLDTSGFQCSVLKLEDQTLKTYLDAPTAAPAWPKILDFEALGPDWDGSTTDKSITTTGRVFKGDYRDGIPEVEACGPILNEQTARVFLTILTFACEALISCARQVDIMDEDSGDGDCGTTLERGATAIKLAIKVGQIVGSRPYVVLSQISFIIERSMGGLQGGLYSIFFDAAAKIFARRSHRDPVDASMWLNALVAGNSAVKELGGAMEGDRTMLDPLQAAQEKLAEALKASHNPIWAFGQAVKAAEERACETLKMPARAGRASLVKCKTFKHPDPGAHAVGIWMRAAYEGVKLKLSCQDETKPVYQID